jgi:hypothetical protein
MGDESFHMRLGGEFIADPIKEVLKAGTVDLLGVLLRCAGTGEGGDVGGHSFDSCIAVKKFEPANIRS